MSLHTTGPVFVFSTGTVFILNVRTLQLYELYVSKNWKSQFDNLALHLKVLNSVCVEVLRPSQPTGVMSSAASLPNHTTTFFGQA